MPLDPTNWNAEGEVKEADYVYKDGRRFFYFDDHWLSVSYDETGNAVHMHGEFPKHKN